jgi:hypothetical protein
VALRKAARHGCLRLREHRIVGGLLGWQHHGVPGVGDTPCSFGLSATSQQYFSLITNQQSATRQQYFSLRINQHQQLATSQTNRPTSRNSSFHVLVELGSP